MKRILVLLTLVFVMVACGNKSKMDPNSPVSQYISLSCEWMELSHRLDNPRLTNSQESSIRDQMDILEGRLEGLQSRSWDYKLTEADREALRNFLENDLPKYGRTASKKDYRIVESAITLSDLE